MALPKPSKSNQKKSAPKEPEKKAEKPTEQKSEKPNDNKKEKKEKPKKEGKQKQPQAPPVDDKPVDVSRLYMKVGKIIECIKHPGKMISLIF